MIKRPSEVMFPILVEESKKKILIIFSHKFALNNCYFLFWFLNMITKVYKQVGYHLVRIYGSKSRLNVISISELRKMMEDDERSNAD